MVRYTLKMILDIMHLRVKNDLELIYDHIAEGVRLRSKCDCYEQGEKSAKLF